MGIFDAAGNRMQCCGDGAKLWRRQQKQQRRRRWHRQRWWWRRPNNTFGYTIPPLCSCWVCSTVWCIRNVCFIINSLLAIRIIYTLYTYEKCRPKGKGQIFLLLFLYKCRSFFFCSFVSVSCVCESICCFFLWIWCGGATATAVANVFFLAHALRCNVIQQYSLFISFEWEWNFYGVSDKDQKWP